MKTFRLLLTAAAFFAVFLPAAAHAKTNGGPASELIFSIKEVRLKDTSGQWIKVPRSAGAFNAASDDPLLNFDNKDGEIPEGDYDNFKIVLTETVKVSGHVGPNKTKSGGRLTVGGTSPTVETVNMVEITSFVQDAPTWTDTAEGEITEHLNLDYEDGNDVMTIYGKHGFPKPLHIKKGSTIQLYLGMDRTEVIHYAWPDFFSGITSDKAVYFLPPPKLGEASFEVDAETRYFSPDDVEWEF